MVPKNAGPADYPHGFFSRLGELEDKIGHHFRNREYLLIALTHSSFSNEKRSRVIFPHNERQEFLGDSVLSLVTSERLFADSAAFPEGILTKLRALAVCADALYDYAEEIGLGEYMLLNHGLEEAGGRHQKNILADCFEALIAAIFLDAGLETARGFILRFVEPRVHRLIAGGKLRVDDYKSLLQEKVQTSPGEKVEYHLIGESGPDHHKEFFVEVCLNSNVIGQGRGTSKREAEQEAARAALCTWFGEAENENA